MIHLPWATSSLSNPKVGALSPLLQDKYRPPKDQQGCTKTKANCGAWVKSHTTSPFPRSAANFPIIVTASSHARPATLPAIPRLHPTPTSVGTNNICYYISLQGHYIFSCTQIVLHVSSQLLLTYEQWDCFLPFVEWPRPVAVRPPFGSANPATGFNEIQAHRIEETLNCRIEPCQI